MARSGGYVSVDVDIDDVLDQMTDDEVLSYFTREQLLRHLRIDEGSAEPVLSDPIQRLAIITQLRAEGYTVEPG